MENTDDKVWYLRIIIIKKSGVKGEEGLQKLAKFLQTKG
jgi:hypothetical protein